MLTLRSKPQGQAVRAFLLFLLSLLFHYFAISPVRCHTLASRQLYIRTSAIFIGHWGRSIVDRPNSVRLRAHETIVDADS